jgi:cell division protein FtsB
MVFLGLLFLFVLVQVTQFDVPLDFAGSPETDTATDEPEATKRSSSRKSYELQNRNLRMRIDRLEREVADREAAYTALQGRYEELAARSGSGRSADGASASSADGSGKQGSQSQSEMAQTIAALRQEVDQLKKEKADLESHAHEMTSLLDTSSPSGNSSAAATSDEPSETQEMLEEEQLIRTVATESLVRLGREAVPSVVLLLRHERAGVREWAAYVLGAIGRPAEEAVPTLLDMLSDSDANVRQTVREALNAIERAQ